MPIFSRFDFQMAVSWVSLIKFQGNKYSQLCLTLCDSVDCSPPSSPVHRIFQARIPEWGAKSSSRGSSWCRDQTCVSCIAGRFFSTGASLVAQKVKHLPAVWETQVGKIPWSRKWHPIPVLLPGKSHGQRSLVGYSPWGPQRVGHDWANSLSFFLSFFLSFPLVPPGNLKGNK